MWNNERNKDTWQSLCACFQGQPEWDGDNWSGKIVLHYTVWFGRLKFPKPKSIVAATGEKGKQENILDLLILKKLGILGAWKALWWSIGELEWFYTGELYWLIVTTRRGMSGELRGLAHWDVGAIREMSGA